MYRIDNATATSTLPTPLAPGPVTKGYFQSGNPGIGQLATTVDRDWANATQEELCAVIEAAGITLAKTDHTQLLAALRQMFAARTLVNADMTIYVNPTSGNDANAGLTPTTAFRTIQAAINSVFFSYDWHDHGCTIQLADGTYSYSTANGYAAYINGVPFGMPFGALSIQGNVANPGNVIINATNANCVGVQFGYLGVSGITFTATGTNGGFFNFSGFGVIAGLGGYIDISGCHFQSCGNMQVNVGNGGIVTLSGTNLSFTGTTSESLYISVGGQIYMPSTTINVTGLGCSGSFVVAAGAGTVNAQAITFIGSATGTRFTATTNGIINTGGGGANYFPGSIAGVQNTGGQYV